jgi:hypothetical protein
VDPDKNGNRFLQWEEGDDWKSLAAFLTQNSNDYYSAKALEEAFGGGTPLGADLIIDVTGAIPTTRSVGGLQDTSFDFVPLGRGARAGKGLWATIKGGVARFFGRKAAQTFAGGVTREMLERAAADPGRTVTVVTQAPQVGRALSVAVGEGAEALANTARSNGRTYTAQIPIALIEHLRTAGLLQQSITQMGGRTAIEYRFAPEAAEFLISFFK